MVVLNKIYTKTGDAGETSLGTGDRVAKYAPRIEAYGTVDETNAAIGMARLHADSDLDVMLERIQNDLFDLGADLCTPDTGEDLGYEPLRIIPEQVTRLEAEIDHLNENLAPLKSFTLPAGTPTATALHLARTISRRAERRMVELSAQETVSPAALRYINRLSDFLFVASRYANAQKDGDVLWKPGANR